MARDFPSAWDFDALSDEDKKKTYVDIREDYVFLRDIVKAMTNVGKRLY